MNNADQYLESKLPLFSNLKKHFDSKPHLKPILKTYMSNEDQGSKTRKIVKEKLVEEGIYKDEDLLEFLLLIAETKRTFNDKPKNPSEEELGIYFFNKYRSENENWSSKDFMFGLENHHSYQTERKRVIEEIAITMIAHSRGSLARAISNPPKEITQLIQEADDFFQQGFQSVFKKTSPLSLTDITKPTEAYTEHADRISGNTFIDYREFYHSPNQFFNFVLHEGLHLCFKGFNESMVEESIIELYLEKMNKRVPPKKYSYFPNSATYNDWKNNLNAVFKGLPGLESRFRKYFLTNNMNQLESYLKKHLTSAKIEEIEEKYYNRGLHTYITNLAKLIPQD